MSRIIIDLNILELDAGRNPFDEFASRLEKLNLAGADPSDIEKLERKLLFIERKCQDLQEVNKEKAMVLLQAVNANLLMMDSSAVNSIEAIAKNLETIENASVDLSNNEVVNPETLKISNFFLSSPHHGSNVDIRDVSDAFNNIFRKYQRSAAADEWIMELNFETRNLEHHKPLEFIYTFIEAVKTIPGVTINLEEIKVGSIKAKIRVVFDDRTSKEEVKELFENVKEIVADKFTRGPTAMDENTATENAETELRITDEKIKDRISDKSKEVEKLETESLRYDLERKKIENERLKLKLFKERKELLKELLSDGLIAQNHLEMLIKGIPFIRIENGNLIIGENIDVIDRL
jgi:hypothetical protein